MIQLQGDSRDMREVEISLKGLIFYILKYWKNILAGMLICALGLSGFKYYKDSKTAQIADTSYGESTGKELSNQEIEYLNSLYVYVQNLRSFNDERKDSLIMKIDPNNAVREDISYLIRVEDPSEIDGIKQAYEQALKGIALSSYVSGNTGIPMQDIIETVSSSVFFSNTDSLTASISVGILSDSVDNSEKVVAEVNEFLCDKSRQLNESGCGHELIPVGESIYQGPDAGVLASQTQYSSEIQSRNRSVLDIEANLDEEHLEYYSSLSNGGSTGAQTETTSQTYKAVSVRSLAKYLLLGLFVGMFLVCGLYAVIYIFANRIDEDDDIDGVYGLLLLGVIPGRDYGKLLYKLRNIGKRTFDFDESIGLAAARVGAIARKETITKLGIIGCGIKKNTEKVAGELSVFLKKYGIEAVIIDDPLYDPDSVEQLRGLEHVILLEKIGVTHRVEVWNEKEMIIKLGIKLDGIIIAG